MRQKTSIQIYALVLISGYLSSAGTSELTASDIKGKVTITSQVAQNRLSGLSLLYTKPSEMSSQNVQSGGVVVYIKNVPESMAPETLANAKLDQINKAFVPHILPVTAGTKVDFPNMDNVYHNVFSLSKKNKFRLGRYASGKSESHTFDTPGIVEVFCDIHSNMYAFILVLPNRFFAKTDINGNFVIKDVPPGIYTLVVWHETLPQKEISVTVPESGDIIITISL
jgi:plastocyanin